MLVNIGDVVDGTLVNAIALVGRQVSIAISGVRNRRRDEDLTVARWFETYRLTGSGPGPLDLVPAQAARLTGILNSDEIQAGLQELLAARLTDAPEKDARSARQVISAILSSAHSDFAQAAEALPDYYDEQICAVVARLEADDPKLLAQIRSEAFSTRMINVLNAIERHTAALSTRPTERTEAAFLVSYRRHIVEQHGKLEPPDFDRRRRVLIANIYVPSIITKVIAPERSSISRPVDGYSLDVYELATRLDRSVLLGDPGGGKTTAANVLMHYFARDEHRQIPFLITLRDYAAEDPPERSVVSYIEHVLATFYQCPAPAGLVDLLLLAGRAVVIFDGLDELLDTARRADVTARVERFCTEFPLARVLVTSRIVGYDQARLDDRQFACYRLGGFGDSEVGEYVRKWFAQEVDARPGDAEAFLAESVSVRDLRSNPLLLSLMCILYRGRGSLPRDRAGIYEQCADLLLRRWDSRRRIHHELRAGHLIEPALRHLAWWLYTRDDTQPMVTERELIDATAKFLHGRGFEAEAEARAAAREFVEFCRGRMWVFSDAGSTGGGERLYAFTHRTFLEYFAAAHLAYSCDSPEGLAAALIPHITDGESWVIAELALQIKDWTSDRGAPRIYATLLGDCPRNSIYVLGFLGLCMRSVDPSPQHVRDLTRLLFDQTLDTERARYSSGFLADSEHNPDNYTQIREFPWDPALGSLLAYCGTYRDTVADEIAAVVSRNVQSGDPDVVVSSLQLASALPYALPFAFSLSGHPEWDYWSSFTNQLVQAHRTATIRAAQHDFYLRHVALITDLITPRHALDMPGGPIVLFQESQGCIGSLFPYFFDTLHALERGWPAFSEPNIVLDLTALGEYIVENPKPPWLRGKVTRLMDYPYRDDGFPHTQSKRPRFAQATYLGAAVALLIMEETGQLAVGIPRRLGPLRGLSAYIKCRREPSRRIALPDLRVPDEFKQTLRNWAMGEENFIRQS